MFAKSISLGLAGLLVLSSCTVVRPGQVGVKQTLGKIKYEPLEPGVRTVMPFTQKVIKVPTNTVNTEQALSLPSKEGLTVGAEISILYHINGDQAPDVIESIGRVYEQDAQRMEFVLQKERQEAEGIRDAQRIISEGLTPLPIQREQIEAFRELATSPNAKVIVTDGQSPPMILEAPE